MDGTDAAGPNLTPSVDGPVDGPVVTRTEVIDAIESAFLHGAITRSQLVEAAELAVVRRPVIDLLQRLPERPYRRPADMWDELPGVPIGI